MSKTLMATEPVGIVSSRLDRGHEVPRPKHAHSVERSCDLRFRFDQEPDQRKGQPSPEQHAALGSSYERCKPSDHSYPAYTRRTLSAPANNGCSGYAGASKVRSGAATPNGGSSALLTGPRMHDIYLKIEGPHLGDLPEDFSSRLQHFLTDTLHMPALHVAVEQGCVQLLVTLLEVSRGTGLVGPSATRLRRRFFTGGNAPDASQLPARLLAFVRGVLPEGAAPGHVTVLHNEQSYELGAAAVHPNDEGLMMEEEAPAGTGEETEACGSGTGGDLGVRTFIRGPAGASGSGCATSAAAVAGAAGPSTPSLRFHHQHLVQPLDPLNETWGSSAVSPKVAGGSAVTQTSPRTNRFTHPIASESGRRSPLPAAAATATAASAKGRVDALCSEAPAAAAGHTSPSTLHHGTGSTLSQGHLQHHSQANHLVPGAALVRDGFMGNARGASASAGGRMAVVDPRLLQCGTHVNEGLLYEQRQQQQLQPSASAEPPVRPCLTIPGRDATPSSLNLRGDASMWLSDARELGASSCGAGVTSLRPIAAVTPIDPRVLGEERQVSNRQMQQHEQQHLACAANAATATNIWGAAALTANLRVVGGAAAAAASGPTEDSGMAAAMVTFTQHQDNPALAAATSAGARPVPPAAAQVNGGGIDGTGGGVGAWAPVLPLSQQPVTAPGGATVGRLQQREPANDPATLQPHPQPGFSPTSRAASSIRARMGRLHLTGGSNHSSNLSWGVDALEALTRPPMPPPQFTAAGSRPAASLASPLAAREPWWPKAVELLSPAVVIWPAPTAANSGGGLAPESTAAAGAGSVTVGGDIGGGNDGVSLLMRCPDLIVRTNVQRSLGFEVGSGRSYGAEGGGGGDIDKALGPGAERGSSAAMYSGHISQLVAWCRTGTIPVVQLDDSLEKCTRARLLMPPPSGAAGSPTSGGDGACAANASPSTAVNSSTGSFTIPATHLVYVAWRRGRALGPARPVLLLPPGMEDIASELVVLSQLPSLATSYQAFLADVGLWLEAVHAVTAATGFGSRSPALFQRPSLHNSTSTQSARNASVMSFSSAGATAATSGSFAAAAGAAAAVADLPMGRSRGDGPAFGARRAVSAPPLPAQTAAPAGACGDATAVAQAPVEAFASPFLTNASPATQAQHTGGPSSAIQSPSPSPSAVCPTAVSCRNILNTSAGASTCSSDSGERLVRVAEDVLNLGCDLLAYSVACGAVATARLLLNMLIIHGPCIQSLPMLAASSGASVASGSTASAFIAVTNSTTHAVGAAAAGMFASPERTATPRLPDVDSGSPLPMLQQHQRQRRTMRAILESCRTGNDAGHTLLHLAIMSRSLPMLQLLVVEWPQQLGLPLSDLNRLDCSGRAPADYLPAEGAGEDGNSGSFAAIAAVLLRGLGPPSTAPAEPLSPSLRSLWGLQVSRDAGSGCVDVPWRAAATAGLGTSTSAAGTSPPGRPSPGAAAASSVSSEGVAGPGGYGGLHNPDGGGGGSRGAVPVDLAAETTSPSLRLLQALSHGRAGNPSHAGGYSGGGGGALVFEAAANAPGVILPGNGSTVSVGAVTVAGEIGLERPGFPAILASGDAEGQGLSAETADNTAVVLPSPLTTARLSGPLTAAPSTTTALSSPCTEMPAAVAAPQVDDRERWLQRRPLWAALMLLLGSMQALVVMLSAMPRARALPPTASLLALPGALLWLPSIALLLAAATAAAVGLLLPSRCRGAAPWLPAAITSAGRAVACILTLAAETQLPYRLAASAAVGATRSELEPVGLTAAALMRRTGGRYAFGVQAALWMLLMTLAPIAVEMVQPTVRTALLLSEYGMPLLYVLAYTESTATVLTWLPYAAFNVVSGGAFVLLLQTHGSRLASDIYNASTSATTDSATTATATVTGATAISPFADWEHSGTSRASGTRLGGAMAMAMAAAAAPSVGSSHATATESLSGGVAATTAPMHTTHPVDTRVASSTLTHSQPAQQRLQQQQQQQQEGQCNQPGQVASLPGSVRQGMFRMFGVPLSEGAATQTTRAAAE
ncbi:hypothetical protein Agub_g13982 [Astrephomene gubernaculifera]|uniref:Uncharacterized protein n=1 Tax=Astrephomene gubernaculifera TaxID=47775 RepID=A0AAD3HST0_9CHLO|nr:hypothetical protein Agub_g13982 [Astrephomene gubernaculifera]